MTDEPSEDLAVRSKVTEAASEIAAAPRALPMMTEELRLTIVPRRQETRILMTEGPDDVLVARLGPVTSAHHRWAAPMLLEALSLWQGRPLRVVLSAESEDYLCSLGIVDGLGLGVSSLHYVVDMVDPREVRRGRRLRGVGDFRDARRQLQLVPR